MNIVIAFTPTMLRPEVKQLGEDVGAIFEDVSGSEMEYGNLVAKLWQQGDSFLLIEHDILPTAALLEEMWACPEPWCSGFAWHYPEFRTQPPVRHRQTALYCHKFSASLIARTPAVPSAVRVRWTGMDLTLLGVLAPQPPPCLHGPLTHLRVQGRPDWVEGVIDSEWADA